MIEDRYPVSAFNSTPWPAFYAISAVLGDVGFVCPAYRGLNTASANGVSVWAYNFAHTPSCSWLQDLPQDALKVVGATHTAEIQFVFGDTTNLPPPNGTCNMTQEEVGISAFMIEAWTSMAANQKPTLNNSLWPAYGNSNESLGINIVDSVAPGYINYTSCQFWDQVAKMLEAAAYNASSSSGGNSSAAASTSQASPPSATSGARMLEARLGDLLLMIVAVSVVLHGFVAI
jgi:carboxylesterase type B